MLNARRCPTYPLHKFDLAFRSVRKKHQPHRHITTVGGEHVEHLYAGKQGESESLGWLRRSMKPIKDMLDVVVAQTVAECQNDRSRR